MKMFCHDCDWEGEDDELDESTECVGEYWGVNAYQTERVCPWCGSSNVEELDELEEEREVEDADSN